MCVTSAAARRSAAWTHIKPRLTHARTGPEVDSRVDLSMETKAALRPFEYDEEVGCPAAVAWRVP